MRTHGRGIPLPTRCVQTNNPSKFKMADNAARRLRSPNHMQRSNIRERERWQPGHLADPFKRKATTDDKLNIKRRRKQCGVSCGAKRGAASPWKRVSAAWQSIIKPILLVSYTLVCEGFCGHVCRRTCAHVCMGANPSV